MVQVSQILQTEWQLSRNIVLDSLNSIDEQVILSAMPFVLKNDYFDIPTEFEVTFLSDSNLYRYGISIIDGEITEEWLYWTKTARETLLFHRTKQTVEYNQRSFSEAKMFTKKTVMYLSLKKQNPLFHSFLFFLSLTEKGQA